MKTIDAAAEMKKLTDKLEHERQLNNTKIVEDMTRQTPAELVDKAV